MEIFILDDDVEFLNQFEVTLKRRFRTLLNDFSVMSTSNWNKQLHGHFDLYFLDIDLTSESGIEVAKEIKMINPDSKIIFITDRNDLVFSAISIRPFYFIRKSELEADLTVAISLLKDCYEEVDYYTIKNYNDIQKINIAEITYIQTEDHLTTIFSKSKAYYEYKPLKTVINEINSEDIVQINRKTCVNIHQIINYTNNQVTLKNGTKLSISRHYREQFHECFKKAYLQE